MALIGAISSGTLANMGSFRQVSVRCRAVMASSSRHAAHSPIRPTVAETAAMLDLEDRSIGLDRTWLDPSFDTAVIRAPLGVSILGVGVR